MQKPCEGMMKGEETMLARTSAGLDMAQNAESEAFRSKEMTELRQHLQTEAENIARWKASTEVKSKNMEREIQEKQSIIDDQRNNLMELQLHSEHLSHSLFQERQERELVNAKVNHTRELFLTLQEQCNQLFKTVSGFQNTKDEIEKEKADVIAKLVNFQQNFMLQEDTVGKIIEKAEEDICHFKKCKETWQMIIIDKDQEIKEKNEELENVRLNVKALSEDLKIITENLSSVENEKIMLLAQLDEVKASLIQTQEEQREQQEKLTDRVTRVDKELKLKHEQLEERTQEFQEAAEKIQYLKKVNDTLEGTMSELTEKVTALASRKHELEEEILHKENMIQNIEETNNKSLVEAGQLQERLNELCSHLSVIETQKENIEIEKNSYVAKLESTKKKLLKKKKLIDQFREQVTSLQGDLDTTKQSCIHLEEVNKQKDEVSQNLEASFKEIIKDLEEKKESLREMSQKIKFIENREVEHIHEKKSIEETLENTSVQLKTKTQECCDLSETLEQMKADKVKIEKECEERTKTISSETKSNKLLQQKISELEENLKENLQKVENLGEECKISKELVAEKEMHLKELKLTLDRALCEKLEIQYKFEAIDESFKNYKSYTDTSLETLRNELDNAKELLHKSQYEHEQKVVELEEELDKSKENLNLTIIAHEKYLQETSKTLLEEHDSSLLQHKKELAELKGKAENMEVKLDQAKQDASEAIKEKLQIKLESDEKVKKMSSLLDAFKTDKEAKLKTALEELQNSKSQISELIQQRDELLAKTKNLECDANEKMQTTAPEVVEMKTPPDVSVGLGLRTPSPSEYLAAVNTFAEPMVPKRPKTRGVAETKRAEHQIPGILKLGGRRTLLPPEQQKRVIFKNLKANKDLTSGDSSSEASTFEIADCDERFEDMKAKRCITHRSKKLPSANIAPFTFETPTSTSSLSPTKSKSDLNDKSDTMLATQHGKRKKTQSDSQRQNLKTYSAVSPKNKQHKSE